MFMTPMLFLGTVTDKPSKSLCLFHVYLYAGTSVITDSQMCICYSISYQNTVCAFSVLISLHPHYSSFRQELVSLEGNNHCVKKKTTKNKALFCRLLAHLMKKISCINQPNVLKHWKTLEPLRKINHPNVALHFIFLWITFPYYYQ